MTPFPQDFFAQLFAETREVLRNYVRRLVRLDDSAEEIVQEAFFRVYEKGDTVQTPRAFLFSTARNLASDLHRKDRITTEHSRGYWVESDPVDVETSLDSVLIADESSRILKHAIDLLPPQCQAALTLRVFHGYSYKEIGEILNISWRTVEKHVVKGTSCVQKYVLARYSGGHDG